MENSNERRYADRVNVPQGKIFYRKLEKFMQLSRYQGPVQLDDMTKSTVSIPVHLNYPRHTPVELKISAPGFPDICLKGKVMEYEEDNRSGMTKTIIQIMPFGYGKIYNSFKIKKKLDKFLSESTDSQEI